MGTVEVVAKCVRGWVLGEWNRSQAIAGLVDGMTTTKGETKEATRRDGRKRAQKESRKESGEECETVRILLLCCSLFVCEAWVEGRRWVR